MTPEDGLKLKEIKVNWRNFEKACSLANKTNVLSVMITGKGEPTLYPKQITEYLKRMKKYNFPIIELQTNGVLFDKAFDKYKEYLKEWHKLGLDIILLSVIHYDKNKNKSLMGHGVDLELLVKRLHDIGYSVRVNCLLIKNYIDSVERILEMVDFIKKNKIEQLTIRNLEKPTNPRNNKISGWIEKNRLEDKELRKIIKYFEENGEALIRFSYGAIVYDLKGQNICLSDCLTMRSDGEELRQLIFFPDGHIRYDWQHEGAILI